MFEWASHITLSTESVLPIAFLVKSQEKHSRGAPASLGENKQHFHDHVGALSLFKYCEASGCELLNPSFYCWFQELPSQRGSGLITDNGACMPDRWTTECLFLCSMSVSRFLVTLLGFIREAWVLRYTIARIWQWNNWCFIERN